MAQIQVYKAFVWDKVQIQVYPALWDKVQIQVYKPVYLALWDMAQIQVYKACVHSTLRHGPDTSL